MLKLKQNLEWFLKTYRKMYRNKLVVSKTPFGCKPGEVKVYIRHKQGRHGSVWKSPCIPETKAFELMDELRRILED